MYFIKEPYILFDNKLSSWGWRPSTGTLNTTLHSDTSLKKLLFPDFWRSVQYRKYRGNIQFQKGSYFVLTEEAHNTEEKRRNQEGHKIKLQTKIESANSPNASGLQGQKMQKKLIKKDIHK